jgi:hypothetical protein
MTLLNVIELLGITIIFYDFFFLTVIKIFNVDDF